MRKNEEKGKSSAEKDGDSMQLVREWRRANTSTVGIEKIGDSTPIQDFEAMMSRRDSPEWEPKQFNDFLHHIYKYCENHNLNSFCESLASKEIMLINKTEAADSEVTEDEARRFMVKKEPKLE
ncbi:hypothetical protein AAG906_038327 [Vitis piasezkii]